MFAAMLSLCVLSIGVLQAEINGTEVEYSAEGTTLKGYLAYDDAVKEKRPGILVVHEWWGHNSYARKRAEMLAELGYIALAIDMYGDGKTANHPQDAGKFASETMRNLPAMKARFSAAMGILKKNKLVDAKRIAAIGYCFGGGVVLAMAREGINLNAVVCFHGSLSTESPAEKGKVKAKILVCTGEEDKFISAEDIEIFKAEMKSGRVDCKVITYPGATHSFTNPAATELGEKFNMPIAYNKAADKKSWEDMKEFFKRVLRK